MASTRPLKKILIPAFDFKPALGGVAHYVHEVLHTLKNLQNYDVRVIAREQFQAPEYDAQSPFPIFRIKTSPLATAALPQWSQALRQQIIEWRPDHILCPLWYPDAVSTELALFALGEKIPYSIVVHGMEVLPAPWKLKDQVRKFLLKPYYKKVFKNCQHVFTVSHFTKNLVEQHTTAESQKIHVIPNGVNVDTYKKTTPSVELLNTLDNPSPLLLSVTRLLPYKGIDQVLKALPEVIKHHPRLKYVVVGRGTDEARLKKMANDLGIADHVQFMGAISADKIIELYNSAHLHVLLSRQEGRDVEGFGLVFLEAAACGLPSVGGASGGIPDAIEDGQSGWLVNPTDTLAIAQLMLDLIKHPEKLKRASDYGLEMVKKKTWTVSVEKMMTVIYG